jgi:hypothetical protein
VVVSGSGVAGMYKSTKGCKVLRSDSSFSNDFNGECVCVCVCTFLPKDVRIACNSPCSCLALLDVAW